MVYRLTWHNCPIFGKPHLPEATLTVRGSQKIALDKAKGIATRTGNTIYVNWETLPRWTVTERHTDKYTN